MVNISVAISHTWYNETNGVFDFADIGKIEGVGAKTRRKRMDHIAFARLSFKENNEMITHSETFEDHGTKSIKLYLEKVSDDGERFDDLTYLYPAGKILSNHGYEEHEVAQRMDEFRQLAEIAMDAQLEREAERR